MFGRQKVAMLLAEFLGTGALTLLILSVQRSTIGVPFFVAMAAGLTVIMMSFAVGGASGGHFNPAITFGHWVVRKISTLNGLLYIVVQLLGAWGAYGIYRYFVNTSLQPIGGHFTWRVFVAEMVGALIFGFGFASAVYQKFSRAANAAFIGLSLMLGIVAASTASIGILNPAVALGIRAWGFVGWMGLGTFVAGPIVGAVVGFLIYATVFSEENPWQMVTSSRAAVTSGSSSVAKKPATRKKLATRKKK